MSMNVYFQSRAFENQLSQNASRVNDRADKLNINASEVLHAQPFNPDTALRCADRLERELKDVSNAGMAPDKRYFMEATVKELREKAAQHGGAPGVTNAPATTNTAKSSSTAPSLNPEFGKPIPGFAPLSMDNILSFLRQSSSPEAQVLAMLLSGMPQDV